MVQQLAQFEKQTIPGISQGRIHVAHLIHSLGSGGAEELLVEFAEAAPSLGIETTVISLLGLNGSRHAARIESAGARVVSVGLGSRWDIRAFARTRVLMESLRPDVLQTHLKHADLVGSWVSRRLGLPMVSTLHRMEQVGTPLERFKRAAGARARLSQAARTVAVSDAQRRWYVETFDADPSLVVTVHNGIREPSPLSGSDRVTVRRELGIGPDECMVTMLGVMRPGKGHADLLAAVRLIPGQLPVRIVMAGDGGLAGDISRSVRGERSLLGRVILPGWRDDVDRLLGASDILVHPTRDDALPTAVIHGLAAGLPVVACDVGGVGELVDGSLGILVPPADPPALASALVELLEDPVRRSAMGRLARDRFEQHFTASAWVARLGVVYREVLDR